MKSFNKIKNILLDCDGTLWIHRKDEILLVTKALGIPLTDEFTQQYFNMIHNLNTSFESQKVTIKKFAKLIKSSIPSLLNYNISAEEFVKIWFSLNTSYINEDSLEFLHYLKSKGYEIIILSDMFYEKQIQLLEAYDIMPYVDVIYTCDNAYIKKNPKSISRIIPTGHENEYVIVGDSLKDDIAFASNAHINSIWYNPNCQKNNTNFTPTVEVQSLLEICKFLQSHKKKY